jgi:hypothetical protein
MNINIFDQFEILEKEFINKNYSKNEKEKDLQYKLDPLNSIIFKIESEGYEKSLSIKEFEEIRKFSISKGGFVSSPLRRFFYKKLFGVSTNNNNNFIHLEDDDARKVQLTSWYKIIDLDVRRTIANHFFKNDNDEENFRLKNDVHTELKSNLSQLLKTFFIINHKKFNYEYYQGFHDIGLYLFIIFSNSEANTLYSLQKVSENFLKDYLAPSNIPNGYGHFRMEKILEILSDLILSIDKNLHRFIQNNSQYSIPPVVLSWIVTFFTHDINEPFLILRILDYLFFSHPIAIFHIAAHVHKYHI